MHGTLYECDHDERQHGGYRLRSVNRAVGVDLTRLVSADVSAQFSIRSRDSARPWSGVLGRWAGLLPILALFMAPYMGALNAKI